MKMEQTELNKILNEHKEWLRTNGEKGKRADLRCADLSCADLRCANLRRADLRCADLRCANLRRADLRCADLSCANLSCADLRFADLRFADLDYSVYPLWCGSLDVHIDDRQATQLLYHLLRNIKYSKNISKEMKKICEIESLVNQANKFHRVDECGKIEMVGEQE